MATAIGTGDLANIDRRPSRACRPLVIAGLVGMLAGALDPLEGSVVILAGAVLAWWGARLGRSRQQTRLTWALVLIAVGVAAMFALSAYGGIGGTTGLSNWWGVLLVPYPIGWVMGLVGAFRILRDETPR